MLAAASFVWCALTIYLSYLLMYTPGVKEPDRNVAIATIVLSAIFCLTFLAYVYLREGDMNAGARIVQGFRWYDAMILFCLLTWSIMALTTCSLLLTYTSTSTTIRNACIANIVISLVFLLQYIVYLYVQEQIPEWCQELERVQEEQYQRLKFRRDLSRGDDYDDYSSSSRSKRAQPQSNPQIIVVSPPSAQQPAPARAKAASAPAVLPQQRQLVPISVRSASAPAALPNQITPVPRNSAPVLQVAASPNPKAKAKSA